MGSHHQVVLPDLSIHCDSGAIELVAALHRTFQVLSEGFPGLLAVRSVIFLHLALLSHRDALLRSVDLAAAFQSLPGLLQLLNQILVLFY